MIASGSTYIMNCTLRLHNGWASAFKKQTFVCKNSYVVKSFLVGKKIGRVRPGEEGQTRPLYKTSWNTFLICELLSCKFVSTTIWHLTHQTGSHPIDGSHPTANGMRNIHGRMATSKNSAETRHCFRKTWRWRRAQIVRPVGYIEWQDYTPFLCKICTSYVRQHPFSCIT